MLGKPRVYPENKGFRTDAGIRALQKERPTANINFVSEFVMPFAESLHKCFLKASSGTEITRLYLVHHQNLETVCPQRVNRGINFPSAMSGLLYALQPAILLERQPSAGIEELQERNFLVDVMGTGKRPLRRAFAKISSVRYSRTYVSQPIGHFSALLAGLSGSNSIPYRSTCSTKKAGVIFSPVCCWWGMR